MSNRREALTLMFQSYIRITSSVGAIQRQFGYLDMYTNAISKKLKSHHALIKQTSRSQGALILEFSWYYKRYAPMELVYCKSYNTCRRFTLKKDKIDKIL